MTKIQINVKEQSHTCFYDNLFATVNPVISFYCVDKFYYLRFSLGIRIFSKRRNHHKERATTEGISQGKESVHMKIGLPYGNCVFSMPIYSNNPCR